MGGQMFNHGSYFLEGQASLSQSASSTEHLPAAAAFESNAHICSGAACLYPTVEI